MSDRPVGTAGLMVKILLLVLLGAPLVAWLWDTLNHLLSGIVEPTRLLIAVPVAFVFFLMLRWLGRIIEGWADTRTS